MQRHWYAVHTYSGHENKVKTNIERRAETMNLKGKIFRILVPTDTEVRNRNGKKTEFKRKVEILQLPAPVLRDLKKLSSEVVREESEKSPMAKKVYASYAKFQGHLSPWNRVAEGAYHQFVAL